MLNEEESDKCPEVFIVFISCFGSGISYFIYFHFAYELKFNIDTKTVTGCLRH